MDEKKYAKCLTVCQPWAWAIQRGVKFVENRTWHTKYRGEILIHAGKSKKFLTPGARLALPELTPEIESELDYSGVVAICDLVDCVPVDKVRGWRFAEGPVCWLLDNVRPLLCSVSLQGQRGVFMVEYSGDPFVVSDAVHRAAWSNP